MAVSGGQHRYKPAAEGLTKVGQTSAQWSGQGT